MSQRLNIVLGSKDMEILAKVMAVGMCASKSEAIRLSIRLAAYMQESYSSGFTDITLRNPSTDEERIILPLIMGTMPLNKFAIDVLSN